MYTLTCTHTHTHIHITATSPTKKTRTDGPASSSTESKATDYSKMTVALLKRELQDKGLDVSGRWRLWATERAPSEVATITLAPRIKRKTLHVGLVVDEMANYRLTCDIRSRRGSLTRAPLLAYKNVVEGKERQ